MWIYIEQPRLFGLCAFALFTVRWVNLYQSHVRRLIPKVWTHNWANKSTTSESLFVSSDGVFGSRSAVTSYLDVVFDRAFNNSAEFLSNDPLSALLGWSLHKNGRLHLLWKLESGTVEYSYCHSGLAFWYWHWMGETSQEFLPPLTQLITKCKRRTKITEKIKRSKQSHSYYPNSVATDRLVLTGDVETNSGPDDARTGRKTSV